MCIIIIIIINIIIIIIIITQTFLSIAGRPAFTDKQSDVRLCHLQAWNAYFVRDKAHIWTVS